MIFTVIFWAFVLGVVGLICWVACAVNSEFRDEMIKNFYEERGYFPNEKELNEYYSLKRAENLI